MRKIALVVLVLLTVTLASASRVAAERCDALFDNANETAASVMPQAQRT